MKYLNLIVAAFILSCSDGKPGSKNAETDFINTAKQFHTLYITAGDCSERNAMVDKEILFYENGKQFTYQNILDYCSYIKPKDAFNIYAEQYLIQPTVGFDFTDQYYLNSEQDTVRETTSRIWELKAGNWVVTHMQVIRQ